MKQVQVLLSTYNGSNYLREMLDSLLWQDYADLTILVRDDGSYDDTLKILGEYANLIDIVPGQNIGVINSFFKLLEMSSHDCDFFAFCDQDDVWKEDKISRAVSVLENYSEEMPLLYCSKATLVDKDLNVIGYTQVPKREPSFKNALVQNIATGCTILINKSARNLLLKEIPRDNFVAMHDWWMYLVVSGFGKVIFDSESRILYRQHELNLIGSTNNILNKWVRRFKRFLRSYKVPLVTKQAKEFRRIYATLLASDKRLVLDRFIENRGSFLERIKYVFNSDVYRQSIADNFILKILISINRI